MGCAAEDVRLEPEGERRRLLPRDERRAQILGAAAIAFSEAGFSATSMEHVADRCGITKLILYRHFGSKAELYESVLTSVRDRIIAEFLDRLGETEGVQQNGPANRGVGAGALLTVAREQPHAFRLLTVHAAREPEFRRFAVEIRELARLAAETVLARRGIVEDWLPWESRVLADSAIDAVLVWLEVGDPDRDEEFLVRTARGFRALSRAWGGIGAVDEGGVG